MYFFSLINNNKGLSINNVIIIPGTIKAMLSGPGQFAENETNEVNFREIPSHVLQKVCMYFSYKVCHVYI